MIELFPRFSKLELKHKKYFDSIAEKHGHYSDFNFTSIFSWNTYNSSEVSLLNGNLVIKMPDYISGEQCISVIGNNNMDDTLNSLFSYTHSLKLVPECSVKSIGKPANFIITEDRDNHDYIYRIKDLVEMKGKRYKDVRNKLSKFKREFTDYEKLHVSTTTVVKIDKFKEFQDVFLKWSVDKSLTDDEIELEQIAINRLLASSNNLDLIIVEISKDGKLLAFSINEIIAQGYAICHFEKAILIHKYFNTYLVKQTADFLSKFGCEKVNWEQDLGLPGLRKSKECYGPSEMLKKYTIKKVN